jgi:aspartate aminotransferase-like enzyme
MLTDWCTWDADYNVHIVEEIRKSLVALATKQTDEYTSVLLQGSGTYCVEAVIGSTVKPGDKLLILSNGAYGDRMGNIAEYHGINYDMLAFDETEQVSVSYVDDYLAHNAEITHVSVVHCETTTGVLNPLKEIAHIVKMHGKMQGWWESCGFETKEQITGLKVCDSPPSENTQTFIDAADQWWNSRDYEHKREIYNRYNSKNE